MRIALVLNDDFSMWRFRKGLISALAECGHRVYTLTPRGPYTGLLEDLGAVHRHVPMYRFVSPLKDIRLGWSLYLAFRRDRIDLVHNMTAKPAIYGAIAGRLAGVERIVALVSGNGIPSMEGAGWKWKLVCVLVRTLYRLAFRITDRVWFQNPDDLSFFVSKGLVAREKAILIRGSGVDLGEFSTDAIDYSKVQCLRKDLGLDESTPVVMMVVARLIWSKGVREFSEAAEILMRRGPRARFILIGPLDPEHPEAVPASYLQERASENFRAIIGFRDDIRECLSLADIVTLPSYFREGVPRGLIEALAMGKPIVTTDHTGCREVVEDGRNGYLVPIKDPAALANAIRRLLEDESLRKELGRNSRRKAETEFDERSVVSGILTDLYGMAPR